MVSYWKPRLGLIPLNRSNNQNSNDMDFITTSAKDRFEIVEDLNENHTIVNGEEIVIINAFVFECGVDVLEF